MAFRPFIKRVGQIALLSVCLIVLLAIARQLSGLAGFAPVPDPFLTPQAEGQQRLLGLLAMSLFNVLTLTYVITRSRWSGWRLAMAIAISGFGVMSVLSQIETFAYPSVALRFPPGLLLAIVAMGALTMLPFAFIAVAVLGKGKPWHTPATHPLLVPARELAWKLPLIGVSYLALYYTFGYYVSWVQPVVHEYYGAAAPVGFWAGVADTFRDTPWMPAFQFLRAMLWTAFALPIIRMMEGNARQAGLAVGLMFGLLMCTQLFLPNPYMPPMVRFFHFWETASSNFLFGLLIGHLLSRPHARSKKSDVKASCA